MTKYYFESIMTLIIISSLGILKKKVSVKKQTNKQTDYSVWNPYHSPKNRSWVATPNKVQHSILHYHLYYVSFPLLSFITI